MNEASAAHCRYVLQLMNPWHVVLLGVPSIDFVGLGMPLFEAQDAAHAWRLFTAEPNAVLFADPDLPDDAAWQLLADAGDRGRADNVIFLNTGDRLSLHLGRALRGGAFTCVAGPLEIAILRELATRSATASETRRTARLRSAAYRSELRLASRVQTAMCPPTFAHVAGLSLEYALLPCSELSGDVVAWTQLPPTQPGGGNEGISLLLADVVGHGVAAALLAVAIRTAYSAFYGPNSNSHCTTPRPLQDLIGSISTALSPFGDERFATLIAMEVRRSSKHGYQLTYVNAGHPTGALLTPDSAAMELTVTGPLLSPAFSGEDAVWETRTLDLPQHATLVVWTDGLNDATAHRRRFADSHLLDTLTRSRRHGTAVVRSLLAAMRSHLMAAPPDDDIAIAAIGAGLPGLA